MRPDGLNYVYAAAANLYTSKHVLKQEFQFPQLARRHPLQWLSEAEDGRMLECRYRIDQSCTRPLRDHQKSHDLRS
jgi:hypothetical protein